MVDTSFYINNGPFTLQKIEQICDAKLQDASKSIVEVKDIAPMDIAKEGEICFFYDKKAKETASQIKATACITNEELAPFVSANVIVLITNNPKMAFLKLNCLLYAEKHALPNTSSSARIHPSALIGENCYIGENVVIGKDVKIGKDCIIEHNAVIDEACVIGDNTRIGVGAHISYCKMGSNCYIYSGARIGQDGFGFLMVAGQHKRIPQVGIVIMGNDVEVGANSCIDRGALDDTVIGDGCRFDNMVQIAHNDKLGRGCVMVALSGIAGSCNFGDYVVCGGQVGIADHVNIGSGAQIAAQSGIMRDVEAGAIVMGTPAVPIKDFMRQVSYLQKSANPVKK